MSISHRFLCSLFSFPSKQRERSQSTKSRSSQLVAAKDTAGELEKALADAQQRLERSERDRQVLQERLRFTESELLAARFALSPSPSSPYTLSASDLEDAQLKERERQQYELQLAQQQQQLAQQQQQPSHSYPRVSPRGTTPTPAVYPFGFQAPVEPLREKIDYSQISLRPAMPLQSPPRGESPPRSRSKLDASSAFELQQQYALHMQHAQMAHAHQQQQAQHHSQQHQQQQQQPFAVALRSPSVNFYGSNKSAQPLQ